MIRVVRSLARPWRVAGRLRALKNTVLSQLQQLLAAQRAVGEEVRELHRTTLTAAIQVIEEQRRLAESLAQDNARLERRLAEVERRVGTPLS